jgi:NhaA family Na+:H+ antiporter
MTAMDPLPPTARSRPDRAMQALAEFFRLESSGGIVLIAAALLALLCANSPLDAWYDSFRSMPVAVVIGNLQIAKPLLLWINDGLMAVFFLLVAIELKREMLSGQLSDRDQVVLPLLCAAAGVAVPAIVFWGINHGDAAALRGWAIPAATDIAFALGILSLLGTRAPIGMKLLLSTIAVVDDLAAIVIIAFFYSSGLSGVALAWAVVAIAGMAVLNVRGVRALTPYLLLGVVVWVCVLKSGVHATLAGVVTGLMIPHRSRKGAAPHDERSPLMTLEHALHPWVAFAILPTFAFANAGLSLGALAPRDLLQPVPLGVALGLLLGKPMGVIGIALLARAAGLARLPDGMDARSIIGLGLLCGIGFTMSLFIASLAFAGTPERAHASVLGILVASLLAAVGGYVWLHVSLPPRAVRDST